jgi:hypothetical protein
VLLIQSIASALDGNLRRGVLGKLRVNSASGA